VYVGKKLFETQAPVYILSDVSSISVPKPTLSYGEIRSTCATYLQRNYRERDNGEEASLNLLSVDGFALSSSNIYCSATLEVMTYLVDRGYSTSRETKWFHLTDREELSLVVLSKSEFKQALQWAEKKRETNRIH